MPLLSRPQAVNREWLDKAAWCKSHAALLCHGKLRSPWHKTSGGCALRDEGKWLLTQPRPGARVRQAKVFVLFWTEFGEGRHFMDENG